MDTSTNRSDDGAGRHLRLVTPHMTREDEDVSPETPPERATSAADLALDHERLRQGDQAEWRRAVSLLQPVVTNLVLYEFRAGGQWEDLVQETFRRAFRSRSTFQGGRSFQAWLLVIAKNVRTDARRKRAKNALVMVERDGVPDLRRTPGSLEEDVLARVDRERKLGRMSERKRQVYLLNREGLQAPEIGERLGMTEEAVRMMISRIRRDLLDEPG